jgi:hypothetical protein
MDKWRHAHHLVKVLQTANVFARAPEVARLNRRSKGMKTHRTKNGRRQHDNHTFHRTQFHEVFECSTVAKPAQCTTSPGMQWTGPQWGRHSAEKASH